jgi:ABC-type transporter Mla subunit MlaD
MALQQTTFGERATSFHALVRVVLVLAVVIVAMIALTAVFGVGQTGPSYDFVPDPAAAAGLPF